MRTGPARRIDADRLRELARSHPAWCVFAAALVVRIVVLVVVRAFTADSWLALDDDTYTRLAADFAAGDTEGWTRDEWGLFRSTAGFLVPLAALFRLAGPSQLVASVLVATVGAGAAGMTTNLAGRAVPTRWAIVAGGVVALLPSQVAWSVTALKDPVVWLVAVGVAVAVAAMPGRRESEVWYWAVAGVGLFLLSHLRVHSSVVAVWALVLTTIVVWRPLRWARLGTALALALTIPWVAGAGVGGADLVSRAADLEQVRAANAEGAESAFADTLPGRGSANDLTALPRGLSAVLLEPFPWAENRNARVVFAKIDTLLWYPLLALALAGTSLIHRRPDVAAFPLLYGGGVTLVYALAEGNLGTAFRHRGEVAWVVALLAAAGAHGLVRRRREESGS